MGNSIHPTAIIGDSVNIGSNNEILPYTVITDGVSLGDDNIIGPHVVIGSSGENISTDSFNGTVSIGNGNIIKEFSTIQKSSVKKTTEICNNIFLRQSTIIPHDAVLESNVSTGPNVAIAGHSILLEGAYIGMGTSIHQFSVIGQYSMVAANATMVKNLKPFAKYIPGKNLQVNDYNVKKYGFENYLDEISKYVLEGVLPKSDVILSIIDKYEKLHIDSKRGSY